MKVARTVHLNTLGLKLCAKFGRGSVQVRGDLADIFMRNGVKKLTFLDKPEYRWTRQTFVAIGVPGGAVILPFHKLDLSGQPTAYAAFCGRYARLLGLTPGVVRYFKLNVRSVR